MKTGEWRGEIFYLATSEGWNLALSHLRPTNRCVAMVKNIHLMHKTEKLCFLRPAFSLPRTLPTRLLFTRKSPTCPQVQPQPCWRSPRSDGSQWAITIQCVIDWTGSHCGSHTCDADTAGKGVWLPLTPPAPSPFPCPQGGCRTLTKASPGLFVKPASSPNPTSPLTESPPPLLSSHLTSRQRCESIG